MSAADRSAEHGLGERGRNVPAPIGALATADPEL